MTPPDNTAGFISPREIVAMLIRRRLLLIVSTALGLLAGIVAIYLQQPQYKSSATLLIESPQIPTSLVASPLTNVANERIAKIRQHAVSKESLLGLMQENGLYPGQRREMPLPNVMNIMRQNIGVDLVGADQSNNGGSTIAFTLSFIYSDPATAQAVTRQLTELFLVEDKRARTEQATGTAAFLRRRADELRRDLAALEEKRRGVEARYAGGLPENVALGAQSSAAIRAEISRTDSETQGLLQQNSMLAARSREAGQAPPAGAEGLRRATDRLNELSAIYADGHPDVVAARAAVERQRQALALNPAPPSANLLEGEIAAGRSRIATLAARRGELVRQMADLDHQTAQAPQAAYELNMIEREYDNIKRQYESLREKELDAQVAANLQSEGKGERFSIIDDPSFPHESLGTKPVALVMGGLLAGAATGAILIIGFNLGLGIINGEASLAAATQVPAFGVVPFRPSSTAVPRASWQGLWERASALSALTRSKRHAS